MADSFIYRATVKTHPEYGAGTNEDVFIRLKGAREVNGDWFLSVRGVDNMEAKKYNPFTFHLRSDYFLGDIESVYIYVEENECDNDGPAWNLDYIEISFSDGGQEKVWRFDVYKWIGVQRRDPSVKMLNYIEVDRQGKITEHNPSSFKLNEFSKKSVENGNQVPNPQ
ncbi:PLAT/LH2 domain-containing protein [Paenibacillus sp. FSL K6-1230]|uniref:PLAT/LH2 domain-containing protein n=1 Tax=Paenibacillus sp. FSL K6-1230 TaxID=2921603 RepID=UPI0030F7D6E4